MPTPGASDLTADDFVIEAVAGTKQVIVWFPSRAVAEKAIASVTAKVAVKKRGSK